VLPWAKGARLRVRHSVRAFAASGPVPMRWWLGQMISSAACVGSEWACSFKALSEQTDLFARCGHRSLAITQLAGWPCVPAVARPGWSQDGEAPAQDPPAQGGCLSLVQSTGIPWIGGWFGERPLAGPSCWPPAATNSAPPAHPWRSPRAGPADPRPSVRNSGKLRPLGQ